MTNKTDRLSKRAYIGRYVVSTVSLSVEHHGGMWYETYIFPGNGKEITDYGEVWGERYATHDEAVAGHKRVCDALRNETLTTYDGAVLVP